MGYRLREVDIESKFCRELTFTSLSRVIPPDVVEAALEAEGLKTQRERKLNLVVTVFLIITMNIYTQSSLGRVMRKIAQGLRYIWNNPEYAVPKDSAITYRRYQLGARPVVRLFRHVCRPIATTETAGAFLFGLRLMAIDGTVEDVADTPENAAAFGRHHSPRGQSAFPQVQGVYLVECGTHTIVDAGFWPCHTSERIGGFRLLRSVEMGMLVMWDRGFHDYDMLRMVLERGGHILSRFPAHVKPKNRCPLPDGSYTAYLTPSDYQRRKRGERLLVRIVEYTISDPALPGYGEVHRLVTTLLNPEAFPALELARAYHERWEIELVIDEVDTHQRLAGRPLRSLKPVGVIQELYGLLIAHFIIRFLMHAAAQRTGLDPDQLSFVHALELVRDTLAEFQKTAVDQLGQLYDRLLHDFADVRLPLRRARSNPRVVKRKMSKFRLKQPEHYHWPQPRQPFRQALALI